MNEMKRSLIVLLSTCLLLISFPNLIAAAWSWTQFTYNNDVWMRNNLDGTDKFDFRLGGGGSLAEMRYIPAGYQHLLSPSYAGEHTDRVMQWTYWINNAQCTNINVPDQRFNVDLAGTMNGTYSPTISVQRSSSKVDVYSVPQNQWYAALDSCFSGKVSNFTRYEMLPEGVLRVRQIVRVANVNKNGTSIGNGYELYLEQWNPFKRGTNEFTALALGLDGGGAPSWWYRAGLNIPYYSNTVVEQTNGYAVVYKENSHATKPVVGVVFGKQQPQLYNTTATAAHVFNSMDWNNGIGVLPALYVYGAQPGSIVDYSYYIVPRDSSNAAFKTKLDALVASAPRPQIYGPGYTFSGELATIVSNLNQNLNAIGTRTENLGSF